MRKNNNNKRNNNKVPKLAVGQEFVPFGTDAIGVITRVSRDGASVSFHYRHAPLFEYSESAYSLANRAAIKPCKAVVPVGA